MATQKNTKSSKVAATKGKPSKTAVAKKPAPKAPAKGKKPTKPVVASKSKAPAKNTAASKTKKAAPVVAKKPVSKVAPKSAPKKVAPVKLSPVKSKTVKPLPKAPVKPAAPKTIAKPVATAKAKVLPVANHTTSKAAQPVSKPIPKATAPILKPTQIVKPVVAVKPPVKAPVKPMVHETPKLVTKNEPAKPIEVEHKPVVIEHKPAVSAAKPVSVVKPESKNTGSKSSDLVKPSVSSKPMEEKPKDQPKEQPKEFQRKSLKQNTAHAVKSHDTMSDKKENKTMGVAFPDEPQKSRYNDKELEEFDQLIDQKLIVAREQLEFYLKQLEDMAENPDNKIKGLDDGLSTLESERVSSMASRQQKLIQHLENAKIRIKNKVYGICRETGKLISKERLRAVPHATLSIEAKQAQN